ncbi:hypothetical protein [Micromonospora wenchangensis]|uniref:hypothetical protein n=1 Tax=Micromonospora wenchangensis TaxID=1185415 RepID=UPI003D742856
MARTWLRSRWTALLIGLAAGAAVGLAVYQGSQLQGRGLYVLCGTTAGAVAAVVVHGYGRSVRLTEITVTIPQFSQATFAVTNDNRAVAWRLFVETATRVSQQPLDNDTGLVREAMNSLYSLFATVRQTIVDASPSTRTGDRPTVEHLAISMLNKEIRPFLSTWHPRLKAWEQEHPERPESDWPGDVACRADLEAMRQRLGRYVTGFAELSGVASPEELIGPLPG